jgi:hypothetical protein
MYYELWYSWRVARTVQARLDERSEQDLAVLRNEGHNDSEAIRVALHEAAERRRRKSALRLEAEAAAADPADRAEALRVREEMDAIAAALNDAG